jgi:acetyltransferase-like isoleucine patch superfamily enzyme
MGRARSVAGRWAERALLRLAGNVDAQSPLAHEVGQWSRSPAIVRDPGPPLLELGAHSAAPEIISFIGDKGAVKIGKWCSIERSARIFVGGEHRTDRATQYPLRLELKLPGLLEDGIPCSKGPVVIGNDVWLGWECLVMSGVTIGDGAVVGARAVVTHDVAPYSVVAGVPARHIRWRFKKPQREALQRIAWWDWPDDKVRAHVGELLGDDVQAFIDAHDVTGPATG